MSTAAASFLARPARSARGRDGTEHDSGAYLKSGSKNFRLNASLRLKNSACPSATHIAARVIGVALVFQLVTRGDRGVILAGVRVQFKLTD